MSTTLEQVEKTAQLSKNNQMSLMIFQVQFPKGTKAPAYYGLNVFKVREVLEARAYEISPIPDSNPLVEGMIELRGVYLPVIDLPKWMGFEMTPEERDKSIIIVSDFSHNFVGLRVAHIHGVEEKNWTDIHPAANYKVDVNTNQVVNHTYLDNSETLCFILDIEKLLIEAMPAMAEKIFSSAKAIQNNAFKFHPQMHEKTILFAEDSQAIQKYMGMVFDQLQLKHKAFDNGRLLIDYINSLDNLDSVAIVFTDLEMPVASGHTVIKELKSNRATRHLPIVVHTSMTSENNSREVLSMGADYFIGKVDTDLILDVVGQIDEKLFGSQANA
ncbi:chemotaxis protein CheV [Thiomicrorhabdus cannonii]|uniref:chemotaxis protein CheV n=1 Tax=Thiomicrorhabdus cannonii TaxID=2748011 RepID=UPI0015BBE585|nr:chemotaxis protein CheV [Thiomicrorhabdus cannonii]